MIPIEISPQKSSVFRCPSCGNNGKAVKTTTLYSLIKKERQDSITDSRYFFCDSKGCDVVYFTENGNQTFHKQDLVVRVGVKEDSPPRPVCYCFNHTVEEIFDEIQLTGKSTVMDDIKLHMKKGGCSCETRNPQGSCCMGTVEYFVKEAFRQFGKTERGGEFMKENLHRIAEDYCCSKVEKGSMEGVRKTNRFAYLGPLGGIISAILASLCCVGPFVLVMLGASGAWVGNLRAFEPYRPIFILFTMGFLGAGFYNVYKKPKDDCKPGSLCAVPQTKKVGKIVLWIAAILVVFLLLLPYLIGLLV
ncbi:MAG: hypothetical protein HY035_03050 [Nitrospirae bacterium]|nr:hypothetical protein [Nitrospirota bacterium]